jgi:hypothetical protein
MIVAIFAAKIFVFIRRQNMALGEMNSGNDIITDTGLTQEGMPADAKSVGDKINAMGPWITFGSIKN